MTFLIMLAAMLLPIAAWAQTPQGATQPSVQVTVEAPRKGGLPHTVTAYGTVQASPDGGSEAMSLLRGGQVTEVFTYTGQPVHKDQPLLVVHADPAAVSAYRQAIAALSLAQGDRARASRMLAQHLATTDQLAKADNAVADAQANLDTLKQAGGGSPEQTLKADFDGVVTALMVAKGARVAAQTPLLTLARTSHLVALVGIEPGVRSQVAVNQAAQIDPMYGTGPVKGRVLSVSAILDPATRLVRVLIDPSAEGSPEGGLLPGSPVRAIVQIGQMTGWLAPRNAVLTDAKGPYLFQVNGGKAVRVDVHVVGNAGATTVVTGPLDPSRPLVTDGNYQLQDGASVREAPPDPATTASAGTTP